MAIILLLTLVGLMVGQNQVSSCDPANLATSNFTNVTVTGSLVKDGDIYEIELAKQNQSVEVVCQAQGATNVTLYCVNDTTVTVNGSSVVNQFTLVNGTRCVCSAQHTSLCFKNSTFTVKTKYLKFTTNGLTNGSANVFAGQSVVLECTVSRASYNMTISDNKNATLSSGKNTDRIVYNLMAPAQPAVYFCSATSSEGTLTQSLQLDIKSNLNGAPRFFNPDFMVFFTIAAILASYC